MDLQCEIDANYNARPCADERKVAGARTMKNNGKNNTQNNGNSRKSGRVLTSGWTPDDMRRRGAQVAATWTEFVLKDCERAWARNSQTRIYAMTQLTTARNNKITS
jgi:hypothetical protein